MDLWGFAPDVCADASVLLKIKALRRSIVEGLKAYLGLGRRALVYFLLGPLVVHMAVGIYLLLALTV